MVYPARDGDWFEAIAIGRSGRLRNHQKSTELIQCVLRLTVYRVVTVLFFAGDFIRKVTHHFREFQTVFCCEQVAEDKPAGVANADEFKERRQ